MIFRQHEQVLNGTKTQTRRLRFPWELAVQLWKYGWSLQRPYAPYAWADWQDKIGDEHVAEANRILARHYITLPIKPHRTAKAIGRIHPTAIRRERLQEITPQAAKAEGVDPHVIHGWGPNYIGYVQAFVNLWDDIQKPGACWRDNPMVYPITFKLVNGA